MRVLVDENLDHMLVALFDVEHAVQTVQRHGWEGMKNGALLRAAERELDAFVTMDKNLEYQQNLPAYTLGFIVIRARSNAHRDVAPLLPEVNEALKRVQPGQVTYVTA